MEQDLVGKSIGNYVVQKHLGSGGMGTVYLCEHPLLRRKAALKVLHEDMADKPEVVDRFFHEAKAATEIGHPNIVDVLDFGRVPGEGGKDLVYLLMEFLKGESLGARSERQRLTIPEIQYVMAQCCDALATSHKKGIIHRDLKPENIYVVHKGDDPLFVKVLDFGIAKLVDDPTQQYHTRTGIILGTPWYMSPEQCAGTGQIDARSDVYSLGVVLYELLVGRVPFDNKGWGDVIIAHLTKEPPAPRSLRPDLPPEWEALVLHALEKDREQRIQTMEEFAGFVADPQRHAAHYQHRVLPPRVAQSDAMLRPTGLGDSDVHHLATVVATAPATASPQPRPRPQPPLTAPPPRAPRSLLALGLVSVVLSALSLIGVAVLATRISQLERSPPPIVSHQVR